MKNEIYPSMQDWFNIWKSVDATHHINKLEKKKWVISIYARKKHLTKSNTHSLLKKKPLSKLGIERNFLNLVKKHLQKTYS